MWFNTPALYIDLILYSGSQNK